MGRETTPQEMPAKAPSEPQAPLGAPGPYGGLAQVPLEQRWGVVERSLARLAAEIEELRLLVGCHGQDRR